jgi:hypothetical protein
MRNDQTSNLLRATPSTVTESPHHDHDHHHLQHNVITSYQQHNSSWGGLSSQKTHDLSIGHSVVVKTPVSQHLKYLVNPSLKVPLNGKFKIHSFPNVQTKRTLTRSILSKATNSDSKTTLLQGGENSLVQPTSSLLRVLSKKTFKGSK